MKSLSKFLMLCSLLSLLMMPMSVSANTVTFTNDTAGGMGDGISARTYAWSVLGFTVPSDQDYILTSYSTIVNTATQASNYELFLVQDVGGMPSPDETVISTASVPLTSIREPITFTANAVVQAGQTYYIGIRSDIAAGSTDTPASGNPPTGGGFAYTKTLYTSDSGTSYIIGSFVLLVDITFITIEEATQQEVRPAFLDGRINDFDTGNPVVLYGTNNDDEWGLNVYDTEGLLLLSVTPQEIASVAECPDVNTLISSVGTISLWRLAGSCQFQLNAPTAEAGKMYIIQFDSLHPHTHYVSWEEWIG